MPVIVYNRIYIYVVHYRITGHDTFEPTANLENIPTEPWGGIGEMKKCRVYQFTDPHVENIESVWKPRRHDRNLESLFGHVIISWEMIS